MDTNIPKPILFIFAVAIQLAIVFGLIVFNASLFVRGAEILLPIQPVDPRDPMRGDYVTFQYEISVIDFDLAGADKNNLSRRGAIAYTTLTKNGDHWIAAGITVKKPADKRGLLFIKGNIDRVGYDYSSGGEYRRKIYLTYGIENYFVAENTGADLVKQIRDKKAFAKIVIDKNGDSALKEVVFGNIPWQENILPSSSNVASAVDTGKPLVAPSRQGDDNDVAAKYSSNDDRRRQDIAAIQRALESYYAANGEYPISGGADTPNIGWSTSNDQSWLALQTKLSPYLAILPKDPINDSEGWPGGGEHVYAYHSLGYGCSQQYYMLVVRYDDPDVLSPGVTACDGTHFNYSGYKGLATIGACKRCDNVPKSIKIIKPNGGEIICLGQKVTIGWKSSGLGMVGMRLVQPAMNGSNYYYIGLNSVPVADESGIHGQGSAVWTVANIPVGDGYKLEIMGLGDDSNIKDQSDEVFSIANCAS